MIGWSHVFRSICCHYPIYEDRERPYPVDIKRSPRVEFSWIAFDYCGKCDTQATTLDYSAYAILETDEFSELIGVMQL